MDPLDPQIYDSRREEGVEAGVRTAKVQKLPLLQTITPKRPWLRIDLAEPDVVNVERLGIGSEELAHSIKTIKGDIA